jgi:Kdo2-lipid IVA lauroyltransferase/acyltransferase
MYYLLYSLLYLLSLLPMGVLYFFSDGFYVIIYYLIRYRREVVMNNLLIAFPEKTKAERTRIAKKFYHNFIDSFIEMVKLVSASDGYLKKRFSIANIESLNELYATGKSCHIHLGHTFNWEWGQLVLATYTPYQVMVVYMPITNQLFEKLLYRLRTRSGSIFLPANNMRKAMEPWLDRQYLLGLVADQNPGNPDTAHWINFFGKPTPFVTGPEKSARASNLPVIFAFMEKPKRGHYRAVIEKITDNAATLPEGELTRRYVRYLEGVIRDNPDMWLWSHRRWKHEWKDQYSKNWIGEESPKLMDLK